MLAGGEFGPGVAAFGAASWIEVGEAAPGPDPILAQLVGAGEAEVIQLARIAGADAVLIDDAKARRVARDAYGLTVIGTVRVLLESRRAGLVDRVGPILTEMRAGGYWIAEGIVERALLEAAER